MDRIDSRELEEWKVFHSISPWGEVRRDIQTALICTTFANSFSKTKYKLKDFMLEFKKPKKKEQSPEQQKTLLQMFCSLWDNPKKVK